MVFMMQIINNSPNGVSTVANVFYLLFSRPLYMIGFTMIMLPIIAGAPVTKPLYNFLSHSFWVPFSRLSYGAFLSHGIFMQFREYNTEKGYWACAFDAFLFFLAFLMFSFFISFFTYIFIE
jgi:peptidoglycan/LPS O-acetylase OafA/YrhL